MPTFTLRTTRSLIKKYENSEELSNADRFITMLMSQGVPKAIQYAFKEELNRNFGLEKITKQLDTSTFLFDPEILIIVQCYDRDGMDVNKKHAVEEYIAFWLHNWLRDAMSESSGGFFDFWRGMPLIDVRLDPKPYSATVIDLEGAIIQQVPKRPDADTRVFPSAIERDTPILWIDGLAARTSNALYNGRVETVGDLCDISDFNIQRIRNFGPVCYQDVLRWLDEHGLPHNLSGKFRF